MNRWTVIRTSNAYVFRGPQQPLAGVPAAKSENPTGTQNQEVLGLLLTRRNLWKTRHKRHQHSALARLGTALAAKQGIEEAAR